MLRALNSASKLAMFRRTSGFLKPFPIYGGGILQSISKMPIFHFSEDFTRMNHTSQLKLKEYISKLLEQHERDKYSFRVSLKSFLRIVNKTKIPQFIIESEDQIIKLSEFIKEDLNEVPTSEWVSYLSILKNISRMGNINIKQNVNFSETLILYANQIEKIDLPFKFLIKFYFLSDQVTNLHQVEKLILEKLGQNEHHFLDPSKILNSYIFITRNTNLNWEIMQRIFKVIFDKFSELSIFQKCKAFEKAMQLHILKIQEINVMLEEIEKDLENCGYKEVLSILKGYSFINMNSMPQLSILNKIAEDMKITEEKNPDSLPATFLIKYFNLIGSLKIIPKIIKANQILLTKAENKIIQEIQNPNYGDSRAIVSFMGAMNRFNISQELKDVLLQHFSIRSFLVQDVESKIMDLFSILSKNYKEGDYLPILLNHLRPRYLSFSYNFLKFLNIIFEMPESQDYLTQLFSEIENTQSEKLQRLSLFGQAIRNEKILNHTKIGILNCLEKYPTNIPYKNMSSMIVFKSVYPDVSFPQVNDQVQSLHHFIKALNPILNMKYDSWKMVSQKYIFSIFEKIPSSEKENFTRLFAVYQLFKKMKVQTKYFGIISSPLLSSDKIWDLNDKTDARLLNALLSFDFLLPNDFKKLKDKIKFNPNSILPSFSYHILLSRFFSNTDTKEEFDFLKNEFLKNPEEMHQDYLTLLLISAKKIKNLSLEEEYQICDLLYKKMDDASMRMSELIRVPLSVCVLNKTEIEPILQKWISIVSSLKSKNITWMKFLDHLKWFSICNISFNFYLFNEIMQTFLQPKEMSLFDAIKAKEKMLEMRKTVIFGINLRLHFQNIMLTILNKSTNVNLSFANQYLADFILAKFKPFHHIDSLFARLILTMNKNSNIYLINSILFKICEMNIEYMKNVKGFLRAVEKMPRIIEALTLNPRYLFLKFYYNQECYEKFQTLLEGLKDGNDIEDVKTYLITEFIINDPKLKIPKNLPNYEVLNQNYLSMINHMFSESVLDGTQQILEKQGINTTKRENIEGRLAPLYCQETNTVIFPLENYHYFDKLSSILTFNVSILTKLFNNLADPPKVMILSLARLRRLTEESIPDFLNASIMNNENTHYAKGLSEEVRENNFHEVDMEIDQNFDINENVDDGFEDEID